MPIVTIYDQHKKKVGDLNLDDRVFKEPFKSSLVYDAVVMQQTNKRQGTASTKTRGEVRGGGKKPFRQKGTGRARQGSTRSSIQVGGGKAFGPHPREYEDRLPKKAYRGALKTVLSQLCKEDRIFVFKELAMKEIKTKVISDILKKFSLSRGLIVDDGNEYLKKAAANLRNFKFVSSVGVNVYDLVRFQYLFISEKALLTLEKRMQS